MCEIVEYIHMQPGAPLPEPARLPSRVIIIAECAVQAAWQAQVSGWIVAVGGLYVMAWGINCSAWDDAVDMASLELANFQEIPGHCAVMTTWHADETLAEMFSFAKEHARHPIIEFERTMILHVGGQARQAELLHSYRSAGSRR